jgi:type IV pilus assembly protein PilV
MSTVNRRIGRRPRFPRRADGFSLLEVLVALLVLSIGLLGLASLQATTSRFNYNAYLRSQATSLAYDIAERMRANRDQALDSAYDVAAFPDPAPVCGAVAGATVAERDISGWQSDLACALPAGMGRIEWDDNVVTIGVSWDDSRGEEAAETFEMTTSL